MNEADMTRKLLEKADAEIGRLRTRVGELEASLRQYSKPLDVGMDNVLAWRLGEIAQAVKEYPREKIGDPIDGGLVLRRLLEEKGFYLIIKKPYPANINMPD